MYVLSNFALTDASSNRRRTSTSQQVVRGSMTSSDQQKVSAGQQNVGSVTSSHSADDLLSGGKVTINYDLGNQFHFEKIFADGTKVGK